MRRFASRDECAFDWQLWALHDPSGPDPRGCPPSRGAPQAPGPRILRICSPWLWRRSPQTHLGHDRHLSSARGAGGCPPDSRGTLQACNWGATASRKGPQLEPLQKGNRVRLGTGPGPGQTAVVARSHHAVRLASLWPQGPPGAVAAQGQRRQHADRGPCPHLPPAEQHGNTPVMAALGRPRRPGSW